MKPILATIALLLVSGCASKPTDSKYYDSAYGKKLDLQIENLNCPIGAALQYDIISGRFGCEQIGTFHATAAQWEAAQGLYTWDLITKDSYEVVDWNGLTECFKCTDDNNDPIDCKAYLHEWQGRILDFEPSVGFIGDTFPPSGDAR